MAPEYYKTCPLCGGSGRREHKDENGNLLYIYTCRYCAGAGQVPAK
jgi:DnaJ-class molecular chaperone